MLFEAKEKRKRTKPLLIRKHHPTPKYNIKTTNNGDDNNVNHPNLSEKGILDMSSNPSNMHMCRTHRYNWQEAGASIQAACAHHLRSLVRNLFLQSSQYHLAKTKQPTLAKCSHNQTWVTWREEHPTAPRRKKGRKGNSPFPLGATFNPTHPRWNHSLGQPSPSHATISP